VAFAVVVRCGAAAARDEVATATARFEGADVIIVNGEVRIRDTDFGARRFTSADVVSLGVRGVRVLVTTDGETLVVTSTRLAEGRFTFASARFGEFTLEQAKVKSLSFDGADKLYAKLLGGFATSGGDLIEPHLLKGSVAVAYVRSTGIETAQTFTVSLDAEAVRANWRHILSARSTFTETDGVRSADSKEASYKADRFLSERAFAYARVGAATDVISGINLRATVGGGGGYRFLVGPRHEFAGEAGYEFQREDAVAGTDDISFGRVGMTYAFKVDAAKVFSEKAEILIGEGRVRLRSETALTAKVNDRISLRLGLIVEHDTNPPAGSPETTTRTTAAMVWTF
jgi:putative salt-induced outer membrane protein YdiY